MSDTDKPMQATTDLTRLITEASVLAGAPHPCTVLGHKWVSRGGRWCGCEGTDEDGGKWTGSCSVPVHECVVCGDCDYGANAVAAETIRECADVE